MSCRLIYDYDIPNRLGFAHWLNNHGLVGNAAEIGVYRGHFSFPFLDAWQGNYLYLIDPWEKLPDTEYDDVRNKEFDNDAYPFMIDMVSKEPYVNRCGLVRCRSAQAVHAIPADVSFDFVYIDANHSYEYVSQDIRMWWGRLSSKAILAGHDIFWLEHPGVTQAVLEFALQYGLTVNLVDGDYDEHCRMIEAPSFYIKKGF